MFQLIIAGVADANIRPRATWGRIISSSLTQW